MSDGKEYHKKELYTQDEKQNILESLDEERRINQEAQKGLDGKKAVYSQSEKNKILDKLNEQRVSKQKYEEIKKRRIENKELYHIGSKKFYKFPHKVKEYFIEVSHCKKISQRAKTFPLYYRRFGNLVKKDVLIKIETNSDKIFISEDLLRAVFKTYSLENKK